MNHNLNLMPFQDEPFNGDPFVENIVLTLKKIFDIKLAIETGTCLGGTTCFLAENFELVRSIEANPDYAAIAINKLQSMGSRSANCGVHIGKSEDLLPIVLDGIQPDGYVFFFLDAHWGPSCPLLQELETIAYKSKVHGFVPIIAIHDFKVPDSPSLGYDSFNFQDFELGWIKPYIDNIYNQPHLFEWNHFYNDDSRSAGAKRGVIYIVPKQRHV